MVIVVMEPGIFVSDPAPSLLYGFGYVHSVAMGLVEAYDFAVCLLPVGPGEFRLDKRSERLREGVGAVAGAKRREMILCSVRMGVGCELVGAPITGIAIGQE